MGSLWRVQLLQEDGILKSLSKLNLAFFFFYSWDVSVTHCEGF